MSKLFAMNENTELLILGLQKDITKVLAEFDEAVNAELGTVKITDSQGSYTRKATEEDKLDFIKSSWEDTVEKLSELGIHIEEAPEEAEGNTSHYYVYGELIKTMEQSFKDGEVAELEYKGIGIPYNSVSIDDNGLGDNVLTFYKDNIEVARMLLDGKKTYDINDTSKYSIELVEVE